MKHILILLPLCFFTVSTHSQNLRWNISLSTDQEIMNVRLRELRNDSLVVGGRDSISALPAGEILRLERHTGKLSGPTIGSATVLGALAGSTVGVIFALLDRQSVSSLQTEFGVADSRADQSLTFLTIGAGVGAMAGTLIANHDKCAVFDIHKLDSAGRSNVLADLAANENMPPPVSTERLTYEYYGKARFPGDSGVSGVPTPRARDITSFFRIYAGASFPEGNTSDDEAVGVYLGSDYGIPITEALDALVSIGVARNEVATSNIVDLGASARPWWTVWPMAGFQFRPVVTNGSEFYFFMQGGLLYGKSPEGEYPADWFPGRNATATAAAYRFGAGALLGQNVLLNFSFQSSDPNYTITTISAGHAVQSNFSRDTELLTVSIGVKF